MKLSDLISPATIYTGANYKTAAAAASAESDKWQVLQSLIETLSKASNFSDEIHHAVIEAVFDREQSMTTGIGEGVAIPHASVEGLKKSYAALQILPEPVEFEAIDHKPVDILILILLPKNQFQKHIRTLAAIARLVNDADFRKELRVTEDAHRAYELIRDTENESG